jgi:2-polyprenyl-6-methoxyphenol hydroxylase-like FAD-dependent oxidoreductase
MAPKTYDLIIVGGGLGGAALAKIMAEHGTAVLVLESELLFRDRVRGEWMASWGVAEAQALGIYNTIMAAGGHELRWFASARLGRRDLIATTIPGVSSVSFYHPHIQEAMLQAALNAGADVRRGTRVRLVTAGGSPTVVAHTSHGDVEATARLVVGADGRNSLVRSWAGLDVSRDPDHILIAGVLFDNMPVPEDAFYTWLNPASGTLALLFPQGHGRVRAYLSYLQGDRLSGETALPQFVARSVAAGAPAAYYEPAHAAGPLATFPGADTWVGHPYRNGIVLIGDAAATSDPTWGQGLSLAVRDVHVLCEQLLHFENWEEAGHAYAEEHDRYYSVIHTYESWQTQMLMTTGPEAEARRAKAMPLWQKDPARLPDVFHNGPDQRLDETVRRQYFGEE